MTKNELNHGGGKFAQRIGSNRKAEKSYDLRALDYAKMVSDPRFKSEGFHKPGSRKKVY